MSSKDAASVQSLLEWCAFDWYVERSPWAGHEVAGPAVLGRALDMHRETCETRLARLNNCRLRTNQELDKTIVQADDLLTAGDSDGARRLLNKIDTAMVVWPRREVWTSRRGLGWIRRSHSPGHTRTRVETEGTAGAGIALSGNIAARGG